MVNHTPRLLDRTSKELRALAMSHEDGAFIGSEEDLMNRLCVSRPTLRQAAAVVAQEQLIRARPGPKGGFFGARPTSASAAHMAAIYLQTRGAESGEILDAIAPIRVGQAQLAARKRKPAHVRKLRSFLREERAFGPGAIAERDFLASEGLFNTLLAQASGNRVLMLFTEILYDLSSSASEGDEMWERRTAAVAHYRRLRNNMAEAIIEGDENLAAVTAARSSSSLAELLKLSYPRDMARADAGKAVL